MTPTRYEIDDFGEATIAHHYCDRACLLADAPTYQHTRTCEVDEDPVTALTPGEVCDYCGAPLIDEEQQS